MQNFQNNFFYSFLLIQGSLTVFILNFSDEISFQMTVSMKDLNRCVYFDKKLKFCKFEKSAFFLVWFPSTILFPILRMSKIIWRVEKVLFKNGNKNSAWSQSYQTMISLLFRFLPLSLAILRYRQNLQTLRLNNEKWKKS